MKNGFHFSATIESKMREIFEIESSDETRLWNKYTSNTYDNGPGSFLPNRNFFSASFEVTLLSFWTNQRSSYSLKFQR